MNSQTKRSSKASKPRKTQVEKGNTSLWNAVYPLAAISELLSTLLSNSQRKKDDEQYCSTDAFTAVSCSCLCNASELPPWQFRVSFSSLDLH